MHQLFDLNIGRFVKVATFKFMAASWEAYQASSATACDENDAIATVLEADFEMAEVVKHSQAILVTCSEPSEQSLELFSLPGTQ